MAKIQLNKHDRHVVALTEQLTPFYDTVTPHVHIHSKKNRPVAEIDILAKKGDFCDVYEVKCSHRITKARYQLRKIRKLIDNDKDHVNVRNTFFFCAESGMLFELS